MFGRSVATEPSTVREAKLGGLFILSDRRPAHDKNAAGGTIQVTLCDIRVSNSHTRSHSDNTLVPIVQPNGTKNVHQDFVDYEVLLVSGKNPPDAPRDHHSAAREYSHSILSPLVFPFAVDQVNSHFFLLGRCVSADPAAVLAALLAFELRSTLEAAVPAFLLVLSFLAISISPPFQLSIQLELPIGAEITDNCVLMTPTIVASISPLRPWTGCSSISCIITTDRTCGT